MKKTARHHHYISQCYLKGFTKNGAKKSKLTVIDLKQRKTFKSNTRNVGGIRDFNRVNYSKVEPDVLEKELSKFEGEVATALNKIKKTAKFEGDTKNIILNFIALLAIRSPQMRETWQKFHADIIEKMMDLSLSSKKRWESLKTSHKEEKKGTSYEEIKKFHESKAYEIKLKTEYHLHIEFVGINALLPYLNHRKWLLVKANKSTGPFITTDNPINLIWNEPDKIPPFYRSHPGFGLKGTQLYFPVSRELALIGEFDGPEGVIAGTKEYVAALNTKMVLFAYKQVYAPKIEFHVVNSSEKISDGNIILKDLNA